MNFSFESVRITVFSLLMNTRVSLCKTEMATAARYRDMKGIYTLQRGFYFEYIILFEILESFEHLKFLKALNT